MRFGLDLRCDMEKACLAVSEVSWNACGRISLQDEGDSGEVIMYEWKQRS